MTKRLALTALLTVPLLFGTYAKETAPHMDPNDIKAINLDDIKTMENITEGLEETIYTSTDMQSFSNEELIEIFKDYILKDGKDDINHIVDIKIMKIYIYLK